jgi:hypothetical protein
MGRERKKKESRKKNEKQGKVGKRMKSKGK